MRKLSVKATEHYSPVDKRKGNGYTFSVKRFVGSFGWTSATYEWLMVALNTIASQTGIFRGARFSSLPTNACSTEDNIPFPSLANHIVLSKFWKVDLDRRVI